MAGRVAAFPQKQSRAVQPHRDGADYPVRHLPAAVHPLRLRLHRLGQYVRRPLHCQPALSGHRLARSRFAVPRRRGRAHFPVGGFVGRAGRRGHRHALRRAGRLLRRQNRLADDAFPRNPQRLPVHVFRHPAHHLLRPQPHPDFCCRRLGVVAGCGTYRARPDFEPETQRVRRSRPRQRPLPPQNRHPPHHPQRTGRGDGVCLAARARHDYVRILPQLFGLGRARADDQLGLHAARRRAHHIETAPWQLLVPSFFLVATLFCFNFLGDGLRDALDPKDR